MQQIRPAKYRIHEYGQIGKFKKSTQDPETIHVMLHFRVLKLVLN